MEHENELKEALDFVSPSALTYDEWLMVGMALKDSGLPVTLWEQWSTRDAGRYHKGECVKKWESFHGGGASPVTASSIFQLAYSHGWSGPAGHALDWNDDISAGTGAQTEGRLVDPRWVEAHELALPEQWDPVDQLKRYLQALFEPDEYVAYVTESFMAADRRRPAKGSWTRTAGQLITELDACGGDLGKVVGDCDPEVGAWICFNPVDGTGRKDANITAYRYALVECDNMELGKQQAIIKQLELPCAALVYSGGKSVHAIVKVDAPDYAEYRRRVDYLYAACQKNGLTIDQQNRNPSRLSRMPGILRGDKRQVLLETNIGKSCWDEWRDWLEAETDELPETESLADDWESLPPLADALITGVLRKGHKMLLAGPSKAGKSFALIELCIAIAEGRPWLGRFSCAQGKVLYINLELDRASCLHRFKDVYTALGLPPQNLRNIDIWNLRGASVPMDKLAPKLIRRAQKKGYTAVILDPIYKVITGDENSADQMAKFCNQFDLVCRALDCAVIYCHHHSKGAQGGKRSMDRASGSGVFARDPDAMLDMTELVPTDAIREQLLSLSSPDVQRRFWNTMQAQSVLRSNFGVQLVEQGNKINNTQYTFTGLKEVYESMCLNLCGASHYPMTKLFGRSPAGMNATGESDLKNYYDYVDTLRESRLRPVLEKLLPVLARSAGIQLEDADLSFPPLWTPTAKETADIAKIKADSIVSAFQSGLLDVPAAQQELRRLSDETGMFGSITDEAIAANAGKTYQDVTALRDPLAGLTENLTGMEVPTADTSVFDFNSRHDPSDGRFTSGGGSGKIEKTKYAPSPQRSESKIQLKPKTYARLTGVLNTQYPGLLAGEKVIIRDANYQYHVTADGFGGLSVERRIPITNRRKK